MVLVLREEARGHRLEAHLADMLRRVENGRVVEQATEVGNEGGEAGVERVRVYGGLLAHVAEAEEVLAVLARDAGGDHRVGGHGAAAGAGACLLLGGAQDAPAFFCLRLCYAAG